MSDEEHNYEFMAMHDSVKADAPCLAVLSSADNDRVSAYVAESMPSAYFLSSDKAPDGTFLSLFMPARATSYPKDRRSGVIPYATHEYRRLVRGARSGVIMSSLVDPEYLADVAMVLHRYRREFYTEEDGYGGVWIRVSPVACRASVSYWDLYVGASVA